MRPIQHHLTDPLLQAYAAGTLPEAFSLAVATHVSMCDQCRAALAAHETMGGAMLENAGLEELSESALTDCLAMLDNLDMDPAETPAPARAGSVPAPLADYVGDSLDKVHWRPIGMGVRQAILTTGDRDACARLLYIPAGVAVPDHSHNGTELTLVLQGGFRDESAEFWPGDIEVADAAVDHTPVALDGAPCICLAVTDAPLRFKSLLPRLAQPFLKI